MADDDCRRESLARDPPESRPASDQSASHASARCRGAAGYRSCNNALDQVAYLSFADQQLVAIARILQLQPRVLVLDEPTSGLGPAEVGRLGTIVRALAAADVSVLFISHRLAEVFELCKEVTVLRDGRAVASVLTESASPAQVMQTMAGAAAGSSLSGPSRMEAGSPGPTVLTAEGLRSQGHCMIAHFEAPRG